MNGVGHNPFTIRAEFVDLVSATGRAPGIGDPYVLLFVYEYTVRPHDLAGAETLQQRTVRTE